MDPSREVVLLLVFGLVTYAAAATSDDHHFAGGALAFKFVDISTSMFQVEITAITGWKLSQGPCGPHCLATDIGRSTTSSRRQAIADSGDETYFGNWTSETAYRHHGTKQTTFNSLMDVVKRNMTGYLSGLNGGLHWEQEVAKVVLDIDSKCEYMHVSFFGKYWLHLNYDEISNRKGYKIQVMIFPQVRNDTGQPNNSPLVMFKPIYKVLLNNKTKIQLASSDPDGDIVECTYSEYVQAGYLEQLINITVSKKCEITFEPYAGEVSRKRSHIPYTNGGWGGIPITLLDINKNAIKLSNGHIKKAGEMTSSPVNIQFLFQTLDKLEMPEFVDPTKPSGHVFKVYVGSTLSIKLHAKQNDATLETVNAFYISSLPQCNMSVSPAESVPGTRTKHSEISWDTKKSDVGSFLVQATVTDTAGVDSQERNYIVTVEDVNSTKPLARPLNGPYFTFFPDAKSIKCQIETTCTFPIYADTTNGHAITNIAIKNSTLKVDAGTVRGLLKSGNNVFKSDISVLTDLHGNQQICFEVTDTTNLKAERCLNVTTYFPDPCLKVPCRIGRTEYCVSHGKDKFTCNCSPGFTGARCETDIDLCQRKPCQNGGSCISFSLLNKNSYFCKCTDNWTSHNCDKRKCKNGGFFQANKCVCPAGWSGPKCETAHETIS